MIMNYYITRIITLLGPQYFSIPFLFQCASLQFRQNYTQPAYWEIISLVVVGAQEWAAITHDLQEMR